MSWISIQVTKDDRTGNNLHKSEILSRNEVHNHTHFGGKKYTPKNVSAKLTYCYLHIHYY
jgi:hypothetical protein